MIKHQIIQINLLWAAKRIFNVSCCLISRVAQIDIIGALISLSASINFASVAAIFALMSSSGVDIVCKNENYNNNNKKEQFDKLCSK